MKHGCSSEILQAAAYEINSHAHADEFRENFAVF
jgi:hypothetical protein